MEIDLIARAGLALAAVFALMAVAAWFARRFGLGGGALGKRHAGRRLQIIETLPLDPRRKLMLVRCDSSEHLLLLGTAGDLIVTSGTTSPPPTARTLQP